MYINSATHYFLTPKHGLHLQFFIFVSPLLTKAVWRNGYLTRWAGAAT